jgi:hypothetical protein
MIVGFLGFIGSGKGTAGDILKEIGFIKQSFAGPVKDTASVMFGWPRHLLEGDTEESRKFREEYDPFWSKKFGYQFTPRMALQTIGTEVGRDLFDANIWISRLEKNIEENKNYVITDVRFKNEMNWIKNNNGILIEIQRDQNPDWYDIAIAANSGSMESELLMYETGVHESEWRWISPSMIDERVQNIGSKDDLKQSLIKILTFYMGKGIVDEILHNGEINETF